MAKSKKNKTLKDYTNEVVHIFGKYSAQGTKPWTHQVATRDLAYQIGSLSKVLLQLENFRYREGLSPQELRAKAADELADIFAEVLFIAHGMGISLAEAWDAMLLSDRKKITERSKKKPA